MANNLPRIVLKKDDATEVEVFLHGKLSKAENRHVM